MKNRSVFILKSNTEYNQYSDIPYNFGGQEITSNDSLENITFKDIYLSDTLIKNLSVTKFVYSGGSIYSRVNSRVYAYNCNFNDSNIDKLNCKESTSSGIPGNSYYHGTIINKIKFSDVKINNCEIGNLYIYNSIFDKVLIKKSLFRANLFKKTEFSSTQIKNVEFRYVTFKNCKLTDTIFNKVNFNNVTFKNCNIYNCSFISNYFNNIKFINCIFINIKWINTNLKKEFFKDLKPPIENTFGLQKNITISTYDFKNLEEIYLNLKNHFRDNGQYQDMSWAFLKEKESERLSYKEEIRRFFILDNFLLEYKKELKYGVKLNRVNKIFILLKYIYLYIGNNFLYFLFGYGEKPVYILSWSIFTIILFSLIFFLKTYYLQTIHLVSNSISYFNCLYFSTLTFTTVGLGDVIPISVGAKIFTMIESLLGLFFYSLFVFSFGKRISSR